MQKILLSQFIKKMIFLDQQIKAKSLEIARIIKNISQKELANKLKCTPATLCKMENGKIEIKDKKIKEILSILGITIINFEKITIIVSELKK